MRVDWLDPQMKQKLQLWEEEPSSSWVHGGKSPAVPRPAALPPSLQDVLERLNFLCWRHRLRTPLFITKCVQVNANGWQRFWYQVVIPGYHTPISGFTWVLQDKQGQSEHEKAKVAAALHILQVLGESLVSPCMASVPTPCLSQSLEVSPGSVELWHFWGRAGWGKEGPRLAVRAETVSPLSCRWDSWLEVQDARGGGFGVRAEPDASLSTAGCQLT